MNKTFSVKHIIYLQSLEGAQLANFRARVGAFVIDFILILSAVILIGLPFAYLSSSAGNDDQMVIPFEPFHSVWGIISLLIYFGLGTYFWRGQTFGKRLLNIRVVSLTGEHLTIWQSIERALGYGASALEAGFGFLQAIWYHNHQAVHDRIAETIVIKENKKKKKDKGQSGK